MTKKITNIDYTSDEIKVSVEYGGEYAISDIDFITSKKGVNNLFKQRDTSPDINYRAMIDYNYPMWKNYPQMAHLAVGNGKPECDEWNDDDLDVLEEDSLSKLKDRVCENPEIILCEKCFDISNHISEFD